MSTILRFGVIGTGNFGRKYVRLLQDIDGAELRAVANRSPAAFAQLPIIRSIPMRRYTDAEELLNDKEVDCVVIATPVSSHFDLCKKAWERGKHVLVEKPMVGCVAEAYELKELIAKNNHQVFMVGHQYVYNDYLRCLKLKLEEGVLGRVLNIFAEHFYLGPIRPDVGCFFETATHELAILDFLFHPKSIVEVNGKMIDFSGSGRDDFSSVSLIFENGLRVTILTSWFAPEKIRRMTFTGEKGMALFDDRASRNKLRFFNCPYPAGSNAKSVFLNPYQVEIQEPYIYAREPLRNQVEYFIYCIKTNTVPLTDIGHGVRITEFLHKIKCSLGFKDRDIS